MNVMGTIQSARVDDGYHDLLARDLSLTFTSVWYSPVRRAANSSCCLLYSAGLSVLSSWSQVGSDKCTAAMERQENLKMKSGWSADVAAGGSVCHIHRKGCPIYHASLPINASH